MKTPLVSLIITFLTSLMLGCASTSVTPISPQTQSGARVEMQTYVNKTYGYSLTLPKTWRAINPMNERRVPLYDEQEKIGPDIALENKEDTIEMEVFSDNTARRPQQSWIEVYREMRLKDTSYVQTLTDSPTGADEKMDSPMPVVSELTFPNKPDRTCMLYEYKNALYTFCYHPKSAMSREVVKSVRFL